MNKALPSSVGLIHSPKSKIRCPLCSIEARKNASDNEGNKKMEPTIQELREIFDCNFETGELTRKKNGNIAGTITHCGGGKYYQRVGVNYHQLYVHRVIWALAYGFWPNHVDHINGDTLDNRLVNLKNSDVTGNMRNRRVFKRHLNNRYGRGVSLRKNVKTGEPQYWASTISSNGKPVTETYRVDRYSLLEVQLRTLERYREMGGYTDLHVSSLLEAINNNPEYKKQQEEGKAQNVEI